MFIRCYGTVAKTPYRLPYAGDKVYSLEELCYRIYQGIYTITEDFFEEDMAVWLRDEVGHSVLADKLSLLISDSRPIKDLVVTTLCACDYYKEDEIKDVVKIIDQIEDLPIHRKKKIRADNYLRAGMYGKSLSAYNALLSGSFAVNFTPKEYGDILHNCGIACFYISSFDEACNYFREAYARNHDLSSLYHYLYILLMRGQSELFEAEGVSSGLKKDEIENVKKAYESACLEVSVPPEQGDDIQRYKERLRKSTI